VRTYDKKRLLISLHIPKCAGTSFTDILKAWFGKKLKFHYVNEKRRKPPKKHKLDKGWINKKPINGLCIHGHFNRERGFGALDYYPEADQFITMLRDPFDIHISHYRYLKTLKGKAYRDGQTHKIASDEKYDIHEYLKRSGSYFLTQFPIKLTYDNYKEYFEKNFVYIGIVEDMQTSIDMLASKLGFDSVKVPVRNVSKHHEVIPAGAREEFIANNPLEYEIYNYALKHYKL